MNIDNLVFWRESGPKPLPDLIFCFIPEPDITAHELAVIVSKCCTYRGPIRFAPDKWDAIPDNIRRHFKP